MMSPQVGTPSMFDAHGTAARVIAPLGWALTAASAFVVIAVTIMLVIAAVRAQRSGAPDVVPEPRAADHRLILIAGVIIPAIITVGALVWTLWAQNTLSAPPSPAVARVRVIGHRWWWEVRYMAPSGGSDSARDVVVTANEIHVPVGRPVQLTLIGADVIHSLWVPQLAGKTDLIPGQQNTMWIEARSTGTYRGMCAEYCGVQHGNMNLVVIAEPWADYAAWLAHASAAATEPEDSLARAGETIFGHSCARCHTIRGTPMLGDSAPDLTHIASRATLGAGRVSNVPGNLAGWIENAPALKPGVMMPAVPLDGHDLRAVVGYLEELR